MPRKFERRLQAWLPHIIVCQLEYDNLNTLEIMKQTGGILRVLGDANVQLDEIVSVLDWLVEKGLLQSVPKSAKKSHYYGIDFNSISYMPSLAFEKLFEIIQVDSRTNRNDEIFGHAINNKTYVFNITFAIEKLVEVKAGLFNI